MRSSQEIDKISEALAAAQGEFKPVVKNKQNPHFKNWYADLTAQIDATREPLCKYGIFIFQTSEVIDGRMVVITRLAHKSGQWLESDVSLKIGQDTPQGMGSHITYARRYGRAMALDLSADEDDDAEIAQKHPSQNPSQEHSRINVVLSSFRSLNITKDYLEKVTGKPMSMWGDEEFSWAQKYFKEAKEKKSKESIV